MNETAKTIIIIAVVLIALFLIPSIWGWGMMGGGMMGGGMMGPGQGGWGWGMGFGWIFGLIFLIAIITGVVWLVKTIASSGTSSSIEKGESALEILKKRYARGEIDRHEFEEKKRDLGPL